MKKYEANTTSAAIAVLPEYLTKKQFAHSLGVSTRTVDALMKGKKVPYLKLTRKLVRFLKSDVDAYLARNFRVNAIGE